MNYYTRSLNLGSQWRAHLEGDSMLWELDCPGLGHNDSKLNTVEVELLMHPQYPQSSGRYYYIPKLNSPLFRSLRAAAKWAMEWEYVEEIETEEVA